MGPRTPGTGRGPEGRLGTGWTHGRSPQRGCPTAHSAHTPHMPPMHTSQAGNMCTPHPWLDPGRVPCPLCSQGEALEMKPCP